VGKTRGSNLDRGSRAVKGRKRKAFTEASSWLAASARALLDWLEIMRRWWRSFRKILRQEPAGKGPSRRERLGRFLEAFSGSRDRVFFVQVGSNDACEGDPLRSFILEWGWSGIMVEPVPYVFDRLAANYAAREGLILENVAIADADEAREFFYLEETDDDIPEWYDQLGSFSRETLLKHRKWIPDIEDRFVCRKVPCRTLTSLLDEHEVDHVDLIQVDTEGFDFEVIKLIDFERFKPEVILYEHKHLDASDKAACAARLESEGYVWSEMGPDTLCLLEEVLVDASSPVGAGWRRWIAPPSGS
jgi:FkbM family methyltransferase